jgi:hypothetical protein
MFTLYLLSARKYVKYLSLGIEGNVVKTERHKGYNTPGYRQKENALFPAIFLCFFCLPRFWTFTHSKILLLPFDSAMILKLFKNYPN